MTAADDQMKIEIDGMWFAVHGAFAPTWIVKRWKLDPQQHPDEYDECQVFASDGMTVREIIDKAIQQGSWA